MNPTGLRYRDVGMSLRQFTVVGLVALGLWSGAACGRSDADVPVAPLPPLPLTEPRDSTAPAPAATPLRPAADWSVLAAILGAFAVLAVFRLRSGRRDRGLPAEVFDVLGEGSLGWQHAVRVVRFGPRTLLVGISSAGSQTLAEIDDPAVTDRIAAACLARPAPRAAARSPFAASSAPPRDATAGGEAA